MSKDTVVDYSIVDVYPLFANCKNLEGREKLEQCFGIELVEQLKKRIVLNEVNGPAATYDTIYVDLLVAKNNKIEISGIKSSDLLKEKIPNFENILIASVSELPTLLQPAIKRGIPVNSKFKLPILIKVKD
jgi:hypothetical protein